MNTEIVNIKVRERDGKIGALNIFYLFVDLDNINHKCIEMLIQSN